MEHFSKSQSFNFSFPITCLKVGATFFRRLSWSPCGSFLTTTHAFASPQHTAAVIDRSNWTKSHDFVGHGAPVVAVRYNGTLFRRSSSADGGKHLPYSCLAMGGQDCRFTVWLSNKAKPLIVGKHFFKQPVVDFAWYVRVLESSRSTFRFQIVP